MSLDQKILQKVISNINKEIIFGDNPFFHANLAIAYTFTEENEDHVKYSIEIVNDIFRTNYTPDDSDKVISFLQKELMNYKNWNCYGINGSLMEFCFLGNIEYIFDEVMNSIDLHINIDSNNNIINYEITY